MSTLFRRIENDSPLLLGAIGIGCILAILLLWNLFRHPIETLSFAYDDLTGKTRDPKPPS